MNSNLLFLSKVYLSKISRQAKNAQGLVEYAIIILLIAVAVIGGVILFRDELVNLYQQIVNQVPFD